MAVAVAVAVAAAYTPYTHYTPYTPYTFGYQHGCLCVAAPSGAKLVTGNYTFPVVNKILKRNSEENGSSGAPPTLVASRILQKVLGWGAQGHPWAPMDVPMGAPMGPQ